MNSLPTPVAASESAPIWGWVRIRALVLDSVRAAHSRRVYATALDDFRDWCERSGTDGFTRETVQRYRGFWKPAASRRPR
jgi:hypothetical protein